MHNFTKNMIGIFLLSIAASFTIDAQAQDRKDTTQYSTDTTTVAVKKTRTKGPRITGKIIDAGTGKVMSGVNVSVPGFSAAITDDKGEFQLNVPAYRATIMVSIQGYHTKLVPFSNEKKISVQLYPDSYASLFAGVYTGSETQSLARSIGAVSYQNGRSWEANNETVSSNLQGRLSGVNVIRRSGTPGIGAETFLRGFTSLYAKNTPLYVVDGMIYNTDSFGPSLNGGHVFNPLQNINVNDVSGVTVVKDAVQTAVYGSRAANGVVFITTNQSPDLDTKINFSVYNGYGFKPKTYPVMNAYDFRTYLTDILSSRGYTAAQIDALPYMNDNKATNPYYAANHNDTKWQDAVFRTSHDQNYYLGISGGDDIAKYSLSLGYLKDQGITDSTSYARYSSRFNSYMNFTKKFTAQVSLAFTYQLQDLKEQGLNPLTNPIFLSLVKSPFFNKNQISTTGAASPKLADVDSLGIGNPRALIDNGTNNTKNYRFIGSTNFDYVFSRSVKFSTLFGLTFDKQQESSFVPRLGVSDVLQNFDPADSRLGTGTGRYFGVSVDSRLRYDRTFNNINKIGAVLGLRYNDDESEYDQVRGINSGTDQLVTIGNSNTANRIFSGRIGKWRTLNSYLSGNYSYADKYLVNASLAVDGSSRFGQQANQGVSINGNRFALFPAVGAAWIISSEDFMKGMRSVDLLKLRGSYGIVGNDDIGNNTARMTYISQNLIGLQGLVRGNLANPAIQWEVVKKLNGGVDASFFNERLSISADYWDHRTDHMLTNQIVSDPTVGTSAYLSNNAAMRTSGFDLSLNLRILNGKFKWDAGFNISTYHNEVTALGSGPIISNYAGGSYLTQVGGAANRFYGLRTNGVFATQAEAASANLSVRSTNGALTPFTGGDMRFVDQNGDHVIDDADRTVIGDPNPKLFGGLDQTFSYKQWRLDALFSFVSGNDVYNYTRSQLESGSSYYNQTPAILNRWRIEGQVTDIPKAVYGDPQGNDRFSDRWIESGSYMRLRTLSLTYSLPFKKGAFKYLNVYLTGNNLLTLTRYKGFDPEFSASESIFTQGVDTTLEPQFRSIQLGLRIGL